MPCFQAYFDGSGITGIVGFNHVAINDGSFILDPFNLADITVNEAGIYLAIFNLYLDANLAEGSAFSITINGVEQANTVFGVEKNIGDTSPYRLTGEALLAINSGDVLRLVNTGVSEQRLLNIADGRLVIAASLILTKVCE
ncbi:hypothetical protein [Hydrogenispora ethanolica]|jgi:hypothetical protein|uniref:hypothetical protein n=1 Tax=Hydrogenispora ethanolica TaxID=1082276 RepID=UPI0010517601|nr:hypothetical protein [Hydrogenispora ethanolica]